MILTHTPQEVAGGFDSAGRPAPVDNGKMVTLLTEMVRGAEAAAEGVVQLATWSALNSVAGTRIGQPGRVMGPDSGTHTDPVVGGSVPNEGEYSWSASPSGWRRVGDTSINQLVAGQDDLSRVARQFLLPPRATEGMMIDVGGWKDAYTVDGDGNVIAGVDANNNFRARLLDAPGVPALTEDLLYAFVTEEGSVLFGFDHDGNFITAGVSPDTRAFTREVAGVSTVFVLKGGNLARFTFESQDAFAPTISGASVQWLEDVGGAISAYTEDIAAETSLSSAIASVRHFLVYGQSLSDGSGSTPVQSVAAVDAGRAVMFNVGPRTRGGNNADVKLVADNIKSFVDLKELGAETPSSQIAGAILGGSLLASDEGLLLSAHGRGGTAYSGLKKGTQPYANILLAARRAKIITSLNGMGYGVPAMSFIHGENDLSVGQSAYLANLIELQADLTSDLHIYTGAATELLLAVDQISNWTHYGARPVTSDVPLAQLEAGLTQSNIICVCPKYMLPTADGVHLGPAESAHLGAMHGRAIAQHLSGTAWLPTHATSAVISGNTIAITFHAPSGEIVLDDVNVTDPGNYGIEFFQTGGNSVTISSVAKAGAREIIVTLSAVPTGTARQIGIARTGIPDQPGGPTTGPRSCIRDSSSDVSSSGIQMWNWACHQLIDVTA